MINSIIQADVGVWGMLGEGGGKDAVIARRRKTIDEDILVGFEVVSGRGLFPSCLT